jgi:hypothetical protein
VSYAGRTYEEGKKIGWRDGVSALRCIVKYTLLNTAPGQTGAAARGAAPPPDEPRRREPQPAEHTHT